MYIYLYTSKQEFKGSRMWQDLDEEAGIYTMIVITRVKYIMTKQELSLGPISFCHFQETIRRKKLKSIRLFSLLPKQLGAA
jgi:hypothetical protein